MRRILLIDEDERLLTYLVERLERRGYETVTARDSEAGVASAKAGKPDLIVLDIGLAGVAGATPTAILRSDPVTHEIPIIMLTAQAEASEREGAMQLGASDSHPKPVDSLRLVEQIEALIGEADSRS